MRVAGIEYPYLSSDERRLGRLRAEYAIASQSNCADIACLIRKTLHALNDQIKAAEKLRLEVSIKETPEREVPTVKYRVEITQTITF